MRHADEQARRALLDAQRLGRAADDLEHRAEVVSDQWRQARERNGFKEALLESMRRTKHS